MDRILTARDYAKIENFRSVKERIQGRCERAQGMIDTPFEDVKPKGKAVKAEINAGRWIANCECGGAEAVDPEEPIFYCFACGNAANQGKPRPVVFPENTDEIEVLLLQRPVTFTNGTNEIARMVNAIPVGYPRSWRPDETIEDLKQQNREMGLPSHPGKVK